MTTVPRRSATPAMQVGLLLTVVAAIAPYVDRATTHVLAHHIRAGYPGYTPARIDSAVTTWLILLSVTGALGTAGWLWSIWAARAGKRWLPWSATALLLLGTGVALAELLVKDTSGDIGLAPLLGMVQMAPCLAGLAAVARLWRTP